MPDDYRPSITRARSCRLATKVSCETLILSNVDYKLPAVKAQGGHFSDDYMKIEADTCAAEEHYLQNELTFANPNSVRGNLEKLSHPNGSRPHEKPDLLAMGQQRTGLAQLLHKVSFCKHSMSDARSPGRKMTRFQTAVHRSSHSAPVILPIGSHSGPANNMSIKAPVLLKASSIIPSNAVTGKMNAPFIMDPSSPKVTCLGRVRIKPHRQSSKATDVVLDDGKGNERHPASLVMYLTRREKKAHNVQACMSPTRHQKRTVKLGFSGNMLLADGCFAKNKVSTSKTASKMAKCTTEELQGMATQVPGRISRNKSKQWSQLEIANYDTEMKASHLFLQKQQIAKDASLLGASCQEVEAFINLSRFASGKSWQQLEVSASISGVVDRSTRFENKAGKESVRQAPPRNALLLMRNSRSKDAPRLENGGDNIHIMQEPPQNALLMMKNSKCKGSYIGDPMCEVSRNAHETNHSTASSDHKIGNIVRVRMQPTCDKLSLAIATKPTLSRMQEPLSMSQNTQNSLVCQLKKSAIHRQAYLQNPEGCLWQRRAVRNPCSLEITIPNQPDIVHVSTT